jgi:putrescine aminotransferase
MSRFWHPFSNMARTEEEGRVVFVRGEGATLIDSEGREYFDATAGLWYCGVGHGRERIAAAIGRQAAELESCSCFDLYASDVTLALADRVAELSPVDEGRVFLTSGGSDGIESAGKIVRRYFALRGQPEKTVMIARQRAYHGMHAYGTSLAGIPGNREGWGTLVDEVELIGSFDLGELERTIAAVGPERVAAFFVEPVIGAGGVYPPPEDYLRAAAEICRRNQVLLVCDEVVTGLGRLGAWTASERYGVRPDLLVLAKILTSGYQPLGAVVISGAIAEPFYAGEGAWLKHGYTYSGHATACAAGLENLDILAEEDLLGRVAALEPKLPELLGGLAELDCVTEVRSIGLMAGIQLDEEALAERGSSAIEVADSCRERGQFTRAIAGGALQFSPPFIATEKQIARFAEAVAATLEQAASPA